MKPNTRFYLRIAVFYAAVVTLLNLTLVWRLKALNQELELHDRASGLEEGDIAPPFSSITSTRGSVKIAFGHSQPIRVLCFLPTTCPYSRQSLPMWQNIAEGKGAGDYDIVGIVTDGAEAAGEIADEAQLSFTLVTVNAAVLERYKIEAVPQTLVVDGAGKVILSHVGRVTEATLADIRKLLQAFARGLRGPSHHKPRRSRRLL